VVSSCGLLKLYAHDLLLASRGIEGPRSRVSIRSSIETSA